MKNINKKRLSIAIAALFIANSAFAQLEEVLVTAQKREQSLQEYKEIYNFFLKVQFYKIFQKFLIFF